MKNRTAKHMQNACTLLMMSLISLTCFSACSPAESKADPTQPRCSVSFSYTPSTHAASVSVIGDFNNWSPNGYELEKIADSPSYKGSFVIGPGRYAYRFLVDNQEITDPTNPLTLYGRDGNEHSALVQGLCLNPHLSINQFEVSDSNAVLDLTFHAGETHADIDPSSLKVLLNNEKNIPVTSSVPPHYTFVIPVSTGRHRVDISAYDENGEAAQPLLIPFWVEETPFSFDQAIIYQIVTDRFRKGGGSLDSDRGITRRMGGDFAGITESIAAGYFEKFGINTLWISPANENALGFWEGFDGRNYESYHGYWPIHPTHVEPAFGSADDLHQLVETAHRYGLRVILDIVPNHVHQDHPDFQNNRVEYFNSPKGDCVCGQDCSWGADIQHCWFTSYLPDYDWTNPDLLDHVLPSFTYWLNTFNLDGLRVDAVPMMPRLVTRWLRYSVNQSWSYSIFPPYLLGETFTGTDGRNQIRQSLGPDGLSGQFDFPLMWTLRSVLAENKGRMEDLLTAAQESQKAWSGSGAVMGLILGNHDVPRFLSLAAHHDVSDVTLSPPQPENREPYDRLKLAWAFLVTLHGAPILYYGDEIGLAGAGDPDNRRAMPKEESLSDIQKDLRENIKLLGRLRRVLPSLRSENLTPLHAEFNVIAYLKSTETNHNLVVLNRGPQPKPVTLTWPDVLSLPPADSYVDCLEAHVTWENRKLSFEIPAFGVMILAEREDCHEAKYGD